VNTSEKGAYSELVACAWLLSQGYEVFRNICPSGPTDIVAIKGGVVERFDVKTQDPHRGSIPPTLTAEQLALGVKILSVGSDGTCWIPSPVSLAQKVPCEGCGGLFWRQHLNHLFCSPRCRLTRRYYPTPASRLKRRPRRSTHEAVAARLAATRAAANVTGVGPP
jgi:hypothetical protein